MSFRFVFWVMLAVLASPAVAGAAETGKAARPTGVIELFTSQGCSSCPPADAVFQEFATSPDFVALAYHVDYWDYLGWRDTLSHADNTERQYSYMRAFGSRSVYTPQAVINGRIHVNGAKRADVMDAFDELNNSGQGIAVDVKLRQSGDSLMIEAGGAPNAVGEAHVMLVYFGPTQRVGIGRGENKGRQVTYWNPVTGIQSAGMWHGEAARYELPADKIPDEGGCAVLLQAVGKGGLPGSIFGAAIMRYSEAEGQEKQQK